MIIFLIKQDGAVEVGVSRKRRKGGRGKVREKARGSSTACLKPRGDVMTAWQFGVKQGLGKDRRVLGLSEKNKQCYRRDEGQELIDRLSAAFSLARSQTEAPVLITCNANVRTRTRHLGTWKCAPNCANSACLHDADKMAARSRSQNASQRRAAIC